MFLEFTGSGLGALETRCKEKEQQMAAIGVRMLAPEKRAAEAAETIQIRHVGESSVLANIAELVGIGMVEMMTFVAECGISCGHSNLVVVDIDVKDGRDGLNNFMSMNVSDEGALHAITPSGGLHLVYRGSVHSQANVKVGVEVRGIGAYFVAPTSGIYDEEGVLKYYKATDDWNRIPA